MGYIENNLVPGETVLYKTRLHWIVLVRPLIVGVVLGTKGLAFVFGGYEASGKDRSYGGMIFLGSLFVVSAAVSIGTGLVRKNSTEVALSNRRVLIKRASFLEKPRKSFCQRLRASGLMNRRLAECLGMGM